MAKLDASLGIVRNSVVSWDVLDVFFLLLLLLGGEKNWNRYHMGRLKASGIWPHLDKKKYYGHTAVSFGGLRKEVAT